MKTLNNIKKIYHETKETFLRMYMHAAYRHW